MNLKLSEGVLQFTKPRFNFFKKKQREAVTIFENTKLDEQILDKYLTEVKEDLWDYEPIIDFDIKNQLGQGGFGVVHEVKSDYFGKFDEYALKLLVHKLMTNDENKIALIKKRFYKECIEMEKLTSILPNDVVNLVDWNSYKGHDFIIMEKMRTLNLRQLEEQDAKIRFVDKLKIMYDVANVMKKVHDLNIVHLDLKPANIMFTKQSMFNYKEEEGHCKLLNNVKVKIGDWGLVRWNNRKYASTHDNEIAGSTPYMAPEQVSNPKKSGKATDIFNYGMMLHELVYGYVPRPRKYELTDSCMDMIKEYVPQLNKPECENEKYLNHIIANCVRMDPGHRFQDFGSVLEHLDFYFGKIADFSAYKK